MQNISFRAPGVRTHRLYSSNGTQIGNYDEPSSSAFIIRTQSGYVGPKSKVKPRPMHAYSFNWQHITAQQLNGDYYYSNGNHEVGVGPTLATTVAGATYPAISTSNLDNQALDRLAQKVRGELDLSVDLAQARQTARMLNVTDQVLDVTRTTIKRFGPIRAASKIWLTWIYGIKPLLGTIYGIADENLRVVINRTQRHRGRASMIVKPPSVTVSTIWGPISFPVVSGEVKCSITYGVNMWEDQVDVARWTSLNPVSIAWELLPYSFVVDWFLNVGGYLRCAETAVLYGGKFVSGYRTTLSRGNCTFELTQVDSVPPDTVYARHRGTVKHVDIQRTLLSAYPAPQLPSFQAELGSSRLLSAASLLGVLLGRR